MKNIYVATKFRGFLKELFNNKFENYNFVWNEKNNYEVNSKIKLIASKIAKSKIADFLGLIQRIDVNYNKFDIGFSYNRFLNTNNKPYIIYLENPTALYHYSLGRNKTYLGKKKINKYLRDQNLKAIVCLSKACYTTINNFYKIPNHIKLAQIYPLVSNNNLHKREIKNKCFRKKVNCLYISSKFNLKGGKEIIKTFEKFENENINNINLRIITQINNMNKNTIDKINNLNNVELNDFKYNKNQLRDIYNDTNILLNPTRQDSFSLVVLEAMKSGNAILSTDLYAIPEMVKNKKNGYLTQPKFRFFNYNNMPNKKVWNNRNTTIYDNYINDNIVDFLYNKIKYLHNNREILKNFSINSYNKSNKGEFNEKNIKDKWIKVFQSLEKRM